MGVGARTARAGAARRQAGKAGKRQRKESYAGRGPQKRAAQARQGIK